jgi:hypothetical protein
MKKIPDNFASLGVNEITTLYEAGNLEGVSELRLSSRQFIDIKPSLLEKLTKKGILYTENPNSN